MESSKTDDFKYSLTAYFNNDLRDCYKERINKDADDI